MGTCYVLTSGGGGGGIRVQVQVWENSCPQFAKAGAKKMMTSDYGNIDF